jgi:hypothetical protein
MIQKLINKKVFGFSLMTVVLVIALLAVGVGAYAFNAWQTTHLQGVGSISVDGDNYSYTLNSDLLNFSAPTNVTFGQSILATATVTIHNNGNKTLNDVAISNIVYPSVGSGWGLWIAVPTITAGNSGTMTVTLSGIAPNEVSTINLSNVSLDITPF